MLSLLDLESDSSVLILAEILTPVLDQLTPLDVRHGRDLNLVGSGNPTELPVLL